MLAYSFTSYFRLNLVLHFLSLSCNNTLCSCYIYICMYAMFSVSLLFVSVNSVWK